MRPLFVVDLDGDVLPEDVLTIFESFPWEEVVWITDEFAFADGVMQWTRGPK